MSRPARLALACVALACACVAPAAEDPYALWGAGRPSEAVPALHARAVASDGWDAWLDCGLAAAAAGDRGRAVAWLLAAHRRAPQRQEPLQALAALDAVPPPGWIPRLGPLAWPGMGWWGAALMAIGGAAIGYGASARRRRPALMLGAICALLVAPGQAAWQSDARRPLAAVIGDTRLLDSAGAAQQPVAAGTIVTRLPRPPWAGRVLVALPDGGRGYLALSDLDAP